MPQRGGFEPRAIIFAMSSIAFPQRHRFDVDAFLRLAEAGVIASKARVELIEGDIVEMAPIGWRHAKIVDRLNRLLVRAAGDEALVSVQNALQLSAFAAPQPDLMLLAPAYESQPRLPEPADVLLVVEVAESSLAFDLGAKADLYARSGVRECWVVDVTRRSIEVLRAPHEGRFIERLTATVGDTVSPLALPGLVIPVASVFD